MVDLATLQFLRDTTAIVVGIAAFIYYILTIRNQNTTRQAQMFMQIYNRMDNTGAEAYYTIMGWEWDDFDDFMEKYGEFKNPKVWIANGSKIANFFQGIGVLVKRNMIEPEIVDELFGHVLVKIWEKMAPIILEYRVGYSSDKWEPIEHLYNVVKPLRDKRLEKILTPNP